MLLSSPLRSLKQHERRDANGASVGSHHFHFNLSSDAPRRLRWRSLLLWLLVGGLACMVLLAALQSLVFPSVDDSDLIERFGLPSSLRHHHIHIAMTSDVSYYVGLLAVINSTVVHCSQPERLRFHIITPDADSSRVLESLLSSLFPSLSLQSVVLDAAAVEALSDSKVWGVYRAASLSKPIVYARYFLPSYFPQLERLLYLDDDVLVLGDIAPLWETDMHGRPIAAARLTRVGAEFSQQFSLRDPALRDFSPEESSFNTGVLLYNLSAWRQADYTAQLLNWTELNKERPLYQLGSQPPFNLVFYNNFELLDRRFNVMDLAGLYGGAAYEPVTVPYAEMRDAVILHWNGGFKPWLCLGHYSELWRQHLPDYQRYLPPPPQPQAAVSNASVCPSQIVWTEGVRKHSDEEKFTVLLLSSEHEHHLPRLVKHLRKCDFIREIVLLWRQTNQSACPQQLDELVRCSPLSSRTSGSRLAAWVDVNTEAVLHHSDDLMAPIRDLEAAFKLWTLNRDRIVGFEPRLLSCPQQDDRRCVLNFTLNTAQLNLMAGKLFFVSQRYMQQASSSPPLLNLTSRAPCEDLVVSFLAAASSAQPPLWFRSNLTDLSVASSARARQKAASREWTSARRSCAFQLFSLFNLTALPVQTRKFHYSRDSVSILQSAVRARESWCSDVSGSGSCIHS